MLRKSSDEGQKDDDGYFGKTKWWKLFHRSVFTSREGVHGVEAPGRKCSISPKSDIWFVKASEGKGR